MKPGCQLCWRDVIVDADGHAAWCCNACAFKLHAVVEAARVAMRNDWECGRSDVARVLAGPLVALIGKKGAK